MYERASVFFFFCSSFSFCNHTPSTFLNEKQFDSRIDFSFIFSLRSFVLHRVCQNGAATGTLHVYRFLCVCEHNYIQQILRTEKPPHSFQFHIYHSSLVEYRRINLSLPKLNFVKFISYNILNIFLNILLSYNQPPSTRYNASSSATHVHKIE